jgi:hypothetical protein
MAYLDADLRDTDHILARAAATLDFTRPVAIMLIAILHYIPDLAQARQIVARLLAAVPAGSRHSDHPVGRRRADPLRSASRLTATLD